MERKALYLFLSFFCGVILFTACNKDDNDGSTSPNNFQFMKIGNYSIFNTTAPITEDSVFVMECTKKFGNGQFSFRFEKFAGVGQFEDTIYIEKVSNNEVAEYADSNFTAGQGFTLINFNDTVGTVYNSPYSTDTRKILDKSASVTVPAGTFNCAKIRTYTPSNPSDSSTFFFHKKKGLVQLQFHGSGSEISLRERNF